MARIKDVRVGQIWTARVSGKFVKVRVNAIREDIPTGFNRKRKTRLSLTNLNTNRQISRTAAFLRRLVSETPAVKVVEKVPVKVTPKPPRLARAAREREKPEFLGGCVWTAPKVEERFRNPGRMGDWKALWKAKRTQKGMDWPWSADGHHEKAVIGSETAAALMVSVGITVANKEWVCIEDGRVFLYSHDCEFRLILLEKENPYD